MAKSVVCGHPGKDVEKAWYGLAWSPGGAAGDGIIKPRSQDRRISRLGGASWEIREEPGIREAMEVGGGV